MDQLKQIFNGVMEGDSCSVQAGVNAALEAGVNPEEILKKCMISAMAEVGQLFEEGEYFVPEMLVAARAMQAGLEILKPKLVEALEAAGLRDQVKVMIGGAPVTDEYARQIGADGYSPDASRAVKLAKSLITV